MRLSAALLVAAKDSDPAVRKSAVSELEHFVARIWLESGDGRVGPSDTARSAKLSATIRGRCVCKRPWAC